MGIGTILEGFLLFANALAILNEDRFLAPKGLTFSEATVGKRQSVKQQLVGLIYAARYMRIPLILCNVLVIIIKLVSG